MTAHRNVAVGAAKLLDSNTNQSPEKSSQGSDELRAHGSSLGKARLDKEGKVANLVGDLVEEDCNSGGSSDCRGGIETGRHGQTVGNIVSEVGAVHVSNVYGRTIPQIW